MTCIAIAAFVSAPIPTDRNNDPALPAVALAQPGLYRLDVALVVFYGGLLLITPAFSGLVNGRLPIEISARGARFAEEAEQSAELANAVVERLEQATESLADDLAAAELEIKKFDELLRRDNTQPKVDSKR